MACVRAATLLSLVLLAFSRSAIAAPRVNAPQRLPSPLRSEFSLPQQIALLDKRIRAAVGDQRQLFQTEQQCSTAVQQLENTGCLWRTVTNVADARANLADTCRRCDRNALESSVARVIDRCRGVRTSMELDLEVIEMLGGFIQLVCEDPNCYADLVFEFLPGASATTIDGPVGPGEPGAPGAPPAEGGEECEAVAVCREDCEEAGTPNEIAQCVATCTRESIDTCREECAEEEDVQGCTAECLGEFCGPNAQTVIPTEPPVECEAVAVCREDCEEAGTPNQVAQCVATCTRESLDTCQEECAEEEDVQGCVAECLGEFCDANARTVLEPVTEPPPENSEEPEPAPECEAVAVCREDCEDAGSPNQVAQCVATCTRESIDTCREECAEEEDIQGCTAECLGEFCGANAQTVIPTEPPVECEAVAVCREDCEEAGSPNQIAQCVATCTRESIDTCREECEEEDDVPACVAECLGEFCGANAQTVLEPALLSSPELQQEGGRNRLLVRDISTIPQELCSPCADRFANFASEFIFARSSSLFSTQQCIASSLDMACVREQSSNQRCVARFDDLFVNFDASVARGELGPFCESSCAFGMSASSTQLVNSRCLGNDNPFGSYTCRNNFRVSDVCTSNANGDICPEAISNFNFEEITNECNVDLRSMTSGANLGLSCSEACRESVEAAVRELGCCVPWMLDTGCNRNADVIQRFFTQTCDVELPTMCAQPQAPPQSPQSAAEAAPASTLSHIGIFGGLLLVVSVLALSN